MFLGVISLQKNEILFIGHSALHYPKSFFNALILLGFKVVEPEYLEYQKPNHFLRIFGTKQHEHKFLEKQNQIYIDAVKQTKPKFIFIVNDHQTNTRFFEYCHKNNIPIYGYFTDSVRWCDYGVKHMHWYTGIYSYEPTDSKTIFRDDLYIKYLPIGFDSTIFNEESLTPRKNLYDICFVGALDKRRLEILETVAKHAYQHNYKLVVYTAIQLKYIDNIWVLPKTLARRLKFNIKYKYLMKSIINKPIGVAELAELYRSSKICLNIHLGTYPGMHTGANPRTFEILACRAMQLIDADHLTHTTLKHGQHLDEFSDNRDLCEKIDLYLTDDKLRTTVAANGLQEVTANYSVVDLVTQLLQCEKLR